MAVQREQSFHSTLVSVSFGAFCPISKRNPGLKYRKHLAEVLPSLTLHLQESDDSKGLFVFAEKKIVFAANFAIDSNLQRSL